MQFMRKQLDLSVVQSAQTPTKNFEGDMKPETIIETGSNSTHP